MLYMDTKRNTLRMITMLRQGYLYAWVVLKGGVPGFEKLVKHLSHRNYASLKISNRILENTGHSGTKGKGYARGLQYVFERPSLHMAAPLLSKFTGSYQLPDGTIMRIKSENNQLVLYFFENNKFLLQAASETDFYSSAEFLHVTFEKDSDGNATSLRLARYSGTLLAKK